jgi:hypothetical protein
MVSFSENEVTVVMKWLQCTCVRYMLGSFSSSNLMLEYDVSNNIKIAWASYAVWHVVGGGGGGGDANIKTRVK